MPEAPRTERNDDLSELRQRIEAIETGTQRREPATNDAERATPRNGLRRSSSLRRSALQRKTPLRRTRKSQADALLASDNPRLSIARNLWARSPVASSTRPVLFSTCEEEPRSN